MNTERCSFVVVAIAVAVLLLAGTASAAPPDATRIAAATGRATETLGDVVKVSVPRSDLAVRIDGAPLAPFQGLTSWAAFQTAGSATMVMGDVVVTEAEAMPALDAALANGLDVTALHNHFFGEEPRVFFMHVSGMGATDDLAKAVAATFAAVDASHARPPVAPGATGASPSTIDPAPLEGILAGKAQAKDGMAKFVFGRTATMHGTDVGAAMGVNTWAVFAGSPDAATVDGDFAMQEGELPGVLGALRRGGVAIVAIHNHMVGEEPRYVFLHYWGHGRADDLARTVKSALDTQTGHG